MHREPEPNPEPDPEPDPEPNPEPEPEPSPEPARTPQPSPHTLGTPPAVRSFMHVPPARSLVLLLLALPACTGALADRGGDAGVPPSTTDAAAPLTDSDTPPPPTDGSIPSPTDFAEPDPAELEPSPTDRGSFADGAGGSGPRGIQRVDAEGRAFPTHRFWSSLAWDFRGDSPYGNNLYPHPLAARGARDGLGIRYLPLPEITPDGRFFQHLLPIPAELDALRIGVAGLAAPEARVIDWSDWTVTARWSDGARTLDATIGAGMPFVYLRATGGEASVRINEAFRAAARIELEGSSAFLTVDGRTYGLFAPRASSWRESAPGELRADVASSGGRFSVAVLPDPSPETRALFAAHAYAFPTDTRVRWAYDEALGRVRTRYEITTEVIEPGASADPIVALLPHQWRHAVTLSGDTISSRYHGPRGELRPIAASAFETELPFRGVLPAMPLVDHSEDARLTRLLAEVDLDAPYPAPSYTAGKALGRYAELLAIAEHLGDTARAERLLSRLRQGLEEWFRPDDGGPSRFRYHEAWSTLISEPADFGADSDLNDHHFHWGYVLRAFAVVALRDPAWAAQWQGMALLLARDATSPLRDDPRFPFLRHFDIYDGHSWASGHAAFAHGNNQESSSEAMHYYTSLILFGEAMGNRTLRDLGAYLYATEASSIAEYWLDVHDEVFPDAYTHPAVGIVWGAGATYGTWWTAEPEAIHGINFLPFHGGSLYLGHHADALAANLAHLVEQNGGPEGTGGGPNDWVDVIWLARAFTDPDEAYARFGAAETTYPVEAGESRAHTLATLASLRALGRVRTDVAADAPLATAFERAGTVSYVAFNAGCSARTVRFSDGGAVELAPRTLVVERAGSVASSLTMGRCM